MMNDNKNTASYWKYSTASDEFLKHEYRTNKVVAFFLFGFTVLGLLNTLLLYIDQSYALMNLQLKIYIPVNAVLLAIICVAWVYRFQQQWIKHMLLCGIIFVSAVTFLFFTTYSTYLLFFPIFISTRYFNRKIIKVVSIVIAILFLISCILNVVLESTSSTFEFLHLDASYNPWHSLYDATIYMFLPCITAMIFLSVFAVNMTSSGQHLIDFKIKSNKKIAAVDSEIDTAAHIQKGALPKPDFISENKCFELFAYESPAKEVCGDFYDYFMLNDDVLGVIVADVSDKGLPAAMFMMSAKKVLQCSLFSQHSLEDAIKLANKMICSDNKYGMFLTLWMCIIDTKSGVGKYVNAGHPYPMIKHRDGTVEFIENEPDLFIGNFPDRTPSVHTFCLNKDDTLLIYTDGLTDAGDGSGNSFGLKRVKEEFESQSQTAREAVMNIVESVNLFSVGNTPFDDITVLALKCDSLPAPEKIAFCEQIGSDGTKKIADGIQELLSSTTCPDNIRRNIGVAVDEICNNISEYAYPDKQGEMKVFASVNNNSIQLVFSDSGTPFNPLDRNDPDTSVINMGGLGIFFVKSLADKISYEYKDSQNNLKTLFVWSL